MPSLKDKQPLEVLGEPLPAAAVYLRNRLAVVSAQSAATTWLELMWQHAHVELQARCPSEPKLGWSCHLSKTNEHPNHGIELRTRDFLDDFREFAPAATKGVTLHAFASDTRVHRRLQGDAVRIVLWFNSNEALRTIANAHGARYDKGREFQGNLKRLRLENGVEKEGDGVLGKWDWPLAMSNRDPVLIAEEIVSRATRASELLLPLFELGQGGTEAGKAPA